MVAPSSHVAEAVAKYGKKNVKVYLDGCSTYYAITKRKVHSQIKLIMITVLPDEKVLEERGVGGVGMWFGGGRVGGVQTKMGLI